MLASTIFSLVVMVGRPNFRLRGKLALSCSSSSTSLPSGSSLYFTSCPLTASSTWPMQTPSLSPKATCTRLFSYFSWMSSG